MIAAVSVIGWSTAMPQSNPPRVTAEFSGACLKWIHAAEPEFEQKKLDLDRYTISVVEDNDSVTVILKSPDAAEGVRGNTGRYPGYEVEIRKKNRKVVRSNYIR